MAPRTGPQYEICVESISYFHVEGSEVTMLMLSASVSRSGSRLTLTDSAVYYKRSTKTERYDLYMVRRNMFGSVG